MAYFGVAAGKNNPAWAMVNLARNSGGSVGIAILVNGEVTLDQGQPTDARSGRLLRYCGMAGKPRPKLVFEDEGCRSSPQKLA
jgi:hypothetical protein